MKKILIIFLIFSLSFSFLFAKELDGNDLMVVNKVLNAQVYVSNFKDVEERLAYLADIEKLVIENELSTEAKIICNSSLKMQKMTAQSTEEIDFINTDMTKPSKIEKTPEAEAFAWDFYNEFKNFADLNEDLSSHFYFHYKAAEFMTLPFLPLNKQIKMLESVADEYKRIEELNPNYGENLLTYGSILYMLPKIVGGDKEAGLEKIKRASEVSLTEYEKVSALVIYSQILFEEKKVEESKTALERAFSFVPENKTLKQIQEVNEAGFSMFRISDYQKKMKKLEKSK